MLCQLLCPVTQLSCLDHCSAEQQGAPRAGAALTERHPGSALASLGGSGVVFVEHLGASWCSFSLSLPCALIVVFQVYRSGFDLKTPQ